MSKSAKKTRLSQQFLEPRKRIRKKIGDVYEIQTSKELAYFQYNIENQKWGSLIRVLQGFYKTRLSREKLDEIVKKPHRFQKFLYLTDAIKDQEVILIDNFPIPEFAKDLPIFKASNDLKTTPSEEKIWWLWDGEKEWKVGKLSLKEQMKYPLERLCDATALIRNIETGMSLGDKLC
jgi:hypothetical protein